MFQGPGFSESRFSRVQVEGLGPGFRSSLYIDYDFIIAFCLVLIELKKASNIWKNWSNLPDN